MVIVLLVQSYMACFLAYLKYLLIKLLPLQVLLTKKVKFNHIETKKVPKAGSPTTAPKTRETTAKNSHKRSDGEVIFRSIIAIALCVIAFATCLSGGVGKLGMALLLIGAAILGYNILK